ncbi:MAG TPA: alternative ribosome rescue aminoacyl-tRNA hydrolase ArfB [Actinomycetota bacterium]|nr:alternative ribosome rescue aminoacyl-tRNA hydrolase ArfB [Actinomycetota bacterium]
MADPTSDLVVNGELTIPARELQWRFSRSSGPGGQSVNTSDSRVVLVWDPRTSHALTSQQRHLLRTPFTVTASEHRSQLQNRQAARHRLARRVESALTPKRKRRRTRPTGASVTRRLEAKRQRSAIKASRRRPPVE